MSDDAVDPDRIDPSIGSLRRHTARGTLINSGFNIGLYALGTAQRFVVAIWLTRAGYGLWGILIAALTTLTFIKQFGIADKYIQQSEPDQELAFQKAFTIELALSFIFFGVACIALPIYAIAYGQPGMILPGVVLALAVPLTAFEAPAWIPYRRLQYARQRLLTSIDPVTTALISITLTAAGFGYWGLILGALAGSLLGGAVCTLTSPIPIRIHLDRATIREYSRFSLPLFGVGLVGFLTIQGTLLTANYAVGLAGVGAMGLAGNVVGMADGIDGIVSQTLYPAMCAVAHRTEALAEAFIKSNRLALMWAVPAMVGIALFAGDLVHFVLGERWRSAEPLLIALALTTAVGQVGFNWTVVLRAVNRTAPLFLVSLVQLAVFALVSLPLTLLWGLAGYAVGFAVVTVSQVALRGYYLSQVFSGFSPMRQLLRAVAPTVPAAALVLGLRAVGGGDHGSLAVAIAELALYCAVAVGATILFERSLVRELVGYLRKARGGPPKAALVADARPA